MSKHLKGDVEFGKRLKELRLVHEYTQAYVEEHARLAQSSMSHFENGTKCPSFANLRSLARFFKVSSDYLLGLK